MNIEPLELSTILLERIFNDDDDDLDGDDIYIMMKCLSVCVSRKIITSSWEAPVTTCNHP